ncbi:MAG: IS1595 family transposase, partial [Sulfuricellaceae bacterium]|nr:IS1595 family transposase [Sulfuricellaceae bacterium]
WVYKFRGVATCYLANYLGWFRALDRDSGNGPNPAQWLTMALGGAA